MSDFSFFPLVSIVIPVFNGGDYLTEAIESALAQKYRNIEILVINDGSSDDGCTEKIARGYSSKIKYFFKENGGTASALNYGIDKMQGDYFSWLSHDDIYAPEKIEEQVRYLSEIDESKRTSVIVYSDFSVFSKSIEQSVPIVSEKVSPDDFQFWLAKDSNLHGCTLLIPKQLLLNFGGFDESLSTTQDYDLWFRLARANHFHQIQKNYVYSRIHHNQNSVILQDVAKNECKKLYSEFVVEIERGNSNKACKQDFFVNYLLLTISMLKRGFYRAAYLSLEHTLRSFSHSSWLSKLLAIKIIVTELMLYPIRTVVRRLPRVFRSRLKNIFGLN
ncbi:glycosyltransferase [Polynucleobacter necessarius]|uniref:glycosyltransferase n=1 Tax=Polynucleobacter necessarius TaxID=576610 RepID=UPI000E091EFF|nr:glycosyltransferase [Polynucleobacter necessarius]